ncbi:WRKY transcription factor 23-like [Macadamia integrifolia]|uniref:WRKY transcription factor 23-like n=1 Tax=Macadamia integrifolia TaxID=60698 RepID=UPI001C4E9F58|nr:WRKY transcription factor 23-like [Macadamia integrifolia]
MAKREVIKTENPNQLASIFPDHQLLRAPDCPLPGSIFDMYGEDEKGGVGVSMGYMDLLGVQDLSPSIFDLLQQHHEQPPLMPLSPPPVESSEVLNLPATPNSSTISSSSTEAGNDEQTKPVDQEEQEKPKKLSKQPQKKNQKRQKEPRFAFMTKSDLDHLEDGYRWRKYGQKAVKNSPFPRNYYRCTTLSCGVKKRVERSSADPSIVVTTYEGQHTHQSPVMHRGSSAGIRPDSIGLASTGATAASFPMQITESHFHHLQHHQQQQQQQQQYFYNFPASFSFNCTSNSTSIPSAHPLVQGKRFCTSPASFLKDNGLLQDIVPSEYTTGM